MTDDDELLDGFYGDCEASFEIKDTDDPDPEWASEDEIAQRDGE